jgi:hypothetical protein
VVDRRTSRLPVDQAIDIAAFDNDSREAHVRCPV